MSAELVFSLSEQYRLVPDEDCPHREQLLLRLNCGPGGIQFRFYCSACWRGSSAIPHAKAHELEALQGFPAPVAAIDTLWRARNQYQGWAL